MSVPERLSRPSQGKPTVSAVAVTECSLRKFGSRHNPPTVAKIRSRRRFLPWRGWIGTNGTERREGGSSPRSQASNGETRASGPAPDTIPPSTMAISGSSSVPTAPGAERQAPDRFTISQVRAALMREGLAGPYEPGRASWISRPPAKPLEQRKPPAAPRENRTHPATGTRPNSNATATTPSTDQGLSNGFIRISRAPVQATTPAHGVAAPAEPFKEAMIWALCRID